MANNKKSDKATIDKLRRRTKESMKKLQAQQDKSKQDEDRYTRLTAALEKNDDEIEDAVDDMDLDSEPNPNDNGSGQPDDKEPDQPNDKEPDQPDDEKPDQPDDKEPDQPHDKKGSKKKPKKKVTVKQEEEETDEEALFAVNSIESDDDEEDDGDEKPEDPELGTALVGAENPESSEDFETLGWTNKFFINRYGPRNAGVFRLERKKERDYEKLTAECVSNKAYGYGRAYDDTSGDYKYDKDSHVVGIFGVAWKHDMSLDRRENVELMNPDKYWKDCGYAIPTTYVLLVWKISGERCKSWETRTVIRRLWGSITEADKDIYKAARVQEKRRGEFETGDREAESRDASVALERATTPPRTSPARGSRKLSPPKESRRHTPAKVASQSPKQKPAKDASQSPKQKPAKDISDIMKELRIDFLDFFGVNSVAELEPEDQDLLRKELRSRRAEASFA
jgi:hypothetical protein